MATQQNHQGQFLSPSPVLNPPYFNMAARVLAITPKFQATRKRKWRKRVKSGLVPALYSFKKVFQKPHLTNSPLTSQAEIRCVVASRRQEAVGGKVAPPSTLPNWIKGGICPSKRMQNEWERQLKVPDRFKYRDSRESFRSNYRQVSKR